MAGLIHERLAAINRGVSAIAKERRNEQQGFRFRGIDDVYDALHDLLAESGVVTIPEVLDEQRSDWQSQRGGTLFRSVVTVRYHLCAEDGSEVTAVVRGEGMDSGDKALAKALSQAHKYLMIQLFTIPVTPELVEDADAESPAEAAGGIPADPVLSKAQRIELVNAAQSAGIPSAAIVDLLRTRFGATSTADLRESQAVQVREWIDARAAEAKQDDNAKEE